MITVAVTQKEYRKAEEVFRRAPDLRCVPAPDDETGLSESIRAAGARHAVVGITTYRRELYEALPRGGVIARFGVGHDGIDKALTESRGLYCCNTPGALDDAVAEFTVGLILSSVRHIAQSASSVRAGDWAGRIGAEVRGKCLAIIGCGRIGRAVAAIARHGLGMRVLGCDVVPPADRDPFDTVTTDVDKAFRCADVLSLHIPAVPSTRDFVNTRRLATMGPTSILVNCARGSIVDEDALFDAIRADRIGGAALDVFRTEPYVPQSAAKDLRTLDRVLMTPHLASSTAEACARMAAAALENIRSVERGALSEASLVRA